MPSAGPVVLAAMVPVGAHEGAVALRQYVVRMRVALDEVQLRAERLVGLDGRGDHANGLVPEELGVAVGPFRHPTRERRHRVDEQARRDDVGVPLVVAVRRLGAPGRHHAAAERILGKAAQVVTVGQQRARDGAQALEIDRRRIEVDRRNEVMDLDQSRRLLVARPVRGKLLQPEIRIDSGRLVCIGGSEVALEKDAGILQDRRAVVRIADVDHSRTRSRRWPRGMLVHDRPVLDESQMAREAKARAIRLHLLQEAAIPSAIRK